jgi:hypothetical protein
MPPKKQIPAFDRRAEELKEMMKPILLLKPAFLTPTK